MEKRKSQTNNWMKSIVDRYGENYILRQISEESCELAQAALKLIRAKREETPVSVEEAMQKLVEEFADVSVMMSFVHTFVFNQSHRELETDFRLEKMKRMKNRMLGG